MKKYFLIAKNTWDEIFTYRLNFVVWRVRSVLQLVTMYFLWLALIPEQGKLLVYNQQTMLTYILGTSFISAIVFSSKIWQVGDEINNGDLSNYLIRPVNYFYYWFAKNIGDKAMNITFSMIEISILLLLLHPHLFIQTNPIFIVFTLITISTAIFLHFFIDFLLGFIAFWNPEVWAPRFIFYAIFPFIAGNLFPLDMLPKPLFILFQCLPFSYLLYFPLKIYLGQLTIFQIFSGLTIVILWTVILAWMVYVVWRKGLRLYTAQGR